MKKSGGCGFPLLSAGQGEDIRDIIEHNIEAVRMKGASRVVFACPTCYQTWKEYYPDEFDLLHVTQFLRGLILQNRLTLKKIDLNITYHDPCDLGRGSREFDAPREVLGAIPGVKLLEMEQNRENCSCCGGGGSLEIFDADLSSEIAKNKMQEVISTGADTVVTSCQQCVRTMNSFCKEKQAAIEVMDIVQLIERALD